MHFVLFVPAKAGIQLSWRKWARAQAWLGPTQGSLIVASRAARLRGDEPGGAGQLSPQASSH